MDFIRTTVVVFMVVAVVSAEVVKYNGHSVVRVTPQTDEQLTTVKVLLEDAELDVWKDPSVVGVPVDIRVGPEQREKWMTLLENEGLDTRVMIQDVQDLIDKTTRPYQPIQNPRDLDTSRYYTLSEIWEFLDEKVEQCAGLCEIINIGTSYEGRDLKVIKIGSTNPDNDVSIWIDNGIHAREWISPAVGMYIIERLIADLGVDEEVDTLREGFNFYIEPVLNVDGYEYTHTTDRMWRKTRSDYGETCMGVDANRNFELGWGGDGSSGDSCSQTYRGPSGFSESETKALDDFVGPMSENFRLVYTYHSYGAFMLYPWGYTSEEEIPDLEDYLAMAELHIDAINSVNDYGYTYRRSSGGMAGNTIDWGYGSMGIKYAFLMELRDYGDYGFLLPPEQILPTDEENWAGMKAMALAILAEE